MRPLSQYWRYEYNAHCTIALNQKEISKVPMPLLDHFYPPLSERRRWQGFHSRWQGSRFRL
jgi:hypothetical protein